MNNKLDKLSMHKTAQSKVCFFVQSIMTYHGGLYNKYYTDYHSMGTYDMVQQGVS